MDATELTLMAQNLVTTDKLSPTQQKDRLTIRAGIFWEHFGENPVGGQITSATILDTYFVEPYIRRIRVTEQPKPLDLGDVSPDDVGYIMLVNTEGTKLEFNPSDAELSSIRRRVVDVGSDFELHPNGRPFIGQPKRNKPLILQCQHGIAIVRAYIYPR